MSSLPTVLLAGLPNPSCSLSLLAEFRAVAKLSLATRPATVPWALVYAVEHRPCLAQAHLLRDHYGADRLVLAVDPPRPDLVALAAVADANGLLALPTALAELPGCVERLLLRQRYISPGLLGAGPALHPDLLNKLGQLSRRELAILNLVAQGLPAGQIAKKLFLSALTVRNHKQNIKLKLGLADRAGLYVFAHLAHPAILALHGGCG